MKTTFKSILALALGVMAMVFASCSTDGGNNPVVPTQQEIETKIVGKWKVAEKEGKKYLTNKKVVLTFNDKGKCTHSFARDLNPFNSYFWINKTAVPYKIENNLVSLSYKNDTEYKMMTYVINNISDDMFSYDEKIITQINDEAFSMMGNHVYQRVTADYSQDIIGMWEGVEMTGYETYGNAEARIEYKADGTYTYYKKVDGYWVPSADADNEYNVDGDWLATRWRPEAGADFNYEWWDIDYIKDGMMKWSALREKEDGTRFNTTFTWKKVDDSASAQNIKANIVGSWQIDHVVRYKITDGNDIHKDIIPYDFMVSTISYTSDLTFSTYDYFVDSEQPDAKIDETRVQGRYSVADRQITHTFDDEPSKMYSNMVYSIDSQTMVIINHSIEGKTEFFSLTYYRKL